MTQARQQPPKKGHDSSLQKGNQHAVALGIQRDPYTVRIRKGEDARCVWVDNSQWADLQWYLMNGYQFVARDEMTPLTPPNLFAPEDTRFGMINPPFTADDRVGHLDANGRGLLLMWTPQSTYEDRERAARERFDNDRAADNRANGVTETPLDD